MPLEPLSEAAIVAAQLRRMADDLYLQADRLEAAAGLHTYRAKENVGYRFGNWGNEDKKTKNRRKK